MIQPLLPDPLTTSQNAPESDALEEDIFVFPASFAQRRLWFLDQWEPGSAAYNYPIALRLVGRLELDLFERSLNTVVLRHETLRTSFGVEDEQPVQIVASRGAIALKKL